MNEAFYALQSKFNTAQRRKPYSIPFPTYGTAPSKSQGRAESLPKEDACPFPCSQLVGHTGLLSCKRLLSRLPALAFPT